MNTRSKWWLAALVVLAAAGAARAEVRLPKIFTDHMVLQQELPIRVWGWADAGQTVSVSFNSQTAQTKAGKDGKWRVTLKPMKADGKAHTLTVQGAPSTGSGQASTIQLKDVLLGEVWLASGQSNMGRPVGGKAIEQANYPRIRLFHVEGKAPRRGDLDGTLGWLICTPEALKTSGDGQPGKRRPFSEVAYHFARHLHEKLKVPVGIIQSNTGGSTARDWTPLADAEEKFPFDKEIKRLAHTAGACYQVKLRGMIPLTLRGFVWYQGEDDGRNRKYTQDLTTMIKTWRKLFGRDDMPFLMGQIAQTTYASGMLGVWESQVQVLKTVPHTGLAPSNDLQDKGMRTDEGNPKRNIAGTGWPIAGRSNPHPPNKHLIAERLANIALAKTYGKGDREVFGPIYDSHEIKGDKVIVKFRHVGDGLKADDGKALNWFEVSDGMRKDKRPNSLYRYVKAEARIVSKDTVEVRSPEVKNPKFVRFAWHALARHNLYNSEGLAAITFRTDTVVTNQR